MTCIAWDGRTLAADKQCTNNGYGYTVTKVFRVQGGRVAFAGSAVHAQQLLAWFAAGRPVKSWPKPPNRIDCADALFLDDERSEAWLYAGQSPHAERIQDTFTAMGAGRDYALAVMHMGYDARRAVEVASALDITCGRGVDALDKA